MRFNDTISGVVLIALACVMVYFTLDFPDFPGQKYGPALFPRLLAGALTICGVMLIARGLPARRAGGPWMTLDDWTGEGTKVTSFFLLLALILFYIFTSEFIGFIPIAFATLLILFLWFKVRPVTAVIVAVAGTWIIHWFFASLMRVPLPRGLLNTIL